LSVTPLHVPLTLPQAFWCAGLVLLCTCLVLLLYATISALFRDDLRRVHQLIGAPSIEEEFEEEGLKLDSSQRQET
jgi:hypothetical protein